MRKLRALLFDRSLPVFILIGAGNTILNWALMLLLYNRLRFDYWGSSAIGFLVTSALSFVLNRRFSFRSEGRLWGDLIRFALVIGACYVAAYAFARPMIRQLMQYGAMQRFSSYTDQAAMIFGNVVFTALNYFGQRFFAFRKAKR